MTLFFTDIGKHVEIADIALRPDERRRLENMGLAIGRPVKTVARDGANIIVAAGNARIALNGAMASKITVK